MALDAARSGGSGAGGGGGGASAASSSPADSYIGSLISLTSKSEIRYEGVLYNINTEESSIGLRQVRSFGTEGRKKDGPQIPASDKIYEYILFRGSDIKDLQVKSSPPVQSTSLHNDPAIIQSQFVHPASTTSNLPSAGSGNVPEPSPHTAQLGLPRSTFQGSLPLYQPGGGIGPWGSSPNPPSANGSGLALPPMCWQGYYAPSAGLPHLQQPALMRPPPGLPLPHSLQYPGLNMSLPPGSQTAPDFSPTLFAAGSSTPGLTSTSLPITTGLTSGSLSMTTGLASNSVPAIQGSTSSLLPATLGLTSSSLSATLPLSSASTLALDTPSNLVLNKSTVTTVPASTVGTTLPLVSPLIPSLEPITTLPPSVPSIFSSKANTVTVPNVPYQSARQPVQLIVGSSSSSQVETSVVPLVTPGHLLQAAPSTLPSSQPMQTSYKEINSKTTEAKTKPLLPDPLAPSVPETKEPILPLPKPIVQKNGAPSHNHYSYRGRGRGRGNGLSRPVTKFTEDFDFTAMNEKFNKDEVWGHLGKGKSHLKDDELQEDEIDDVYEEEEEVPEVEVKPVYIKDDFFDSLSSNTLDRGNRNGRTKFSEQMKIDTETFGDFARHRPRGGGHGFRGGGRARGSYYGRGYGYVGRGRGYGRAA